MSSGVWIGIGELVDILEMISKLLLPGKHVVVCGIDIKVVVAN